MFLVSFYGHKGITNHPKRVTNIKPFIDLCNWNGIKYLIIINNNNYALFERKNPRIALV